jgi:hypothetical protein
MRSDKSRVSKSRASSPDGRGVTLPISEPFPINPQTSASPNAGQPLAMQKRVRQTIITQQHSVQLAFFRNAGLPAELCRLVARRLRRAEGRRALTGGRYASGMKSFSSLSKCRPVDLTALSPRDFESLAPHLKSRRIQGSLGVSLPSRVIGNRLGQASSHQRVGA